MTKTPHAVTATALAVAIASHAQAAELPLFLACETRDGTQVAVLAESDDGLRFTLGDQPPIEGVERAGSFAYRLTVDLARHRYSYLRRGYGEADWEIARMREGIQSAAPCVDVSDIGAAAVKLADDRVRELADEVDALRAQLEQQEEAHLAEMRELRQAHITSVDEQARAHRDRLDALRDQHKAQGGVSKACWFALCSSAPVG